MKKIALFVGCFMGYCSLLFSQEFTDTITLEKVTVSDFLYDDAVLIPATSLTHITQEEMRESGYRNSLPVIQNMTPGVFVTERGVLGYGVAQGGAGAISIRGIGGTPNHSVLMLVDGQPQYQGIFGHPLPDTYLSGDAEHVTIIRGPASILYGSNAMGGAIVITSPTQKTDGVSGYVTGANGCFNTQQYDAALGYRKEKLYSYFTLNHGFTDGHRGNSDFSMLQGSMKIGYDISDNWTVSARQMASSFSGNDPGPSHARDSFAIDVQRNTAAITLSNTYEKTSGTFILYRNDGIHDLSSGWKSEDFAAGVILNQSCKLNEHNTKLTVGSAYKQIGGVGNGGVGRDILHRIHELAAYSFLTHPISQSFVVSGGLRLEHNSAQNTQHLTPYAGMQYQIQKNMAVQGSYSQGFRNPTVMELYLYAPNQDLEPEHIHNVEISYIQNMLNNRLRYQITGFILQAQNIIQVEGQFPVAQRQNTGEYTNRGIEAALDYVIRSDFRVRSNYTYLDISKPVLGAPKHQYNVAADYTYKIFRIHVTMQHVRDLYLSVPQEITTQYTRINAGISARPKPYVEGFFFAQNILNKTYEINHGYRLPGMTMTGGLKFLW